MGKKWLTNAASAAGRALLSGIGGRACSLLCPLTSAGICGRAAVAEGLRKRGETRLAASAIPAPDLPPAGDLIRAAFGQRMGRIHNRKRAQAEAGLARLEALSRGPQGYSYADLRAEVMPDAVGCMGAEGKL